MTTVNFRYKGSSSSGNRGHAGRPGKVGGSAPASFKYPITSASGQITSDKINIAGKTGAQWTQESTDLSKSKTEELRAKLASENLDQTKVDDFIDRLNTHRALVLSETLQTSRGYYLSKDEQSELMDDVVNHDVDKYDTKVAIPYITRHGDEKGKLSQEFWEAQRNHANENQHHETYWEIPGTGRANQMSTVALIELVGDWKATAKHFKTTEDWYYKKNGGGMVLHPNTRWAIERELGLKHSPFPNKFPRDFFQHKELTVKFRYKGSTTSEPSK